MADDKKQSADEIVDNLAEEMGVKDEKVPESGESSEDVVADLGGIFGVSSKKKKKKKKKKEAEPQPQPEVSDDEELEAEVEVDEDDAEAEEEPEAEEEEEDEDEVAEEPAPEKSAKKKKKKKPAGGIDGVFNPSAGSSSGGGDVIAEDPYLGEDDLDGIDPPGNGVNKALVGVIVVLGLALVGVVGTQTEVGQDVMLVFQGEYRSRKDAERKRQEEEFNKAQEEALPKFGNLLITGSPKYAMIKLNGEVKYGKTSSGAWRPVQLKPGSSNFANLPIKEKHLIEVSSPGFEAANFELTEGKWEGEGNYSFNYNAQLVPLNEWHKSEFDARMGSDLDNEFYGSVTINTSPEGATVEFDNHELLDKQGEPMKTPVTFESYWVKDEETGKLEETQIRVDTPFDKGHKLKVHFPEEPAMPVYVNQVNRPMWVCEKLEESEIKKLPEEHSPQLECAYEYKLNLDFEALKGFIEQREKERERIDAYNKKIREMKMKAAKGEDIDPETAEAIKSNP